MANKVLDALLQGASAEAAKVPLSYDRLAQLVEVMKTAPDYDHFYRASYDGILKVMEDDQRRGARVNAFGRLLVHPLDPLFAENRLDRRLIGNFFFFVRSLFGDEVEAMAEQSAEIADELRGPDGGQLAWARFYADPRAKRMYFSVMSRLLSAFARFAARPDWAVQV